MEQKTISGLEPVNWILVEQKAGRGDAASYSRPLLGLGHELSSQIPPATTATINQIQANTIQPNTSKYNSTKNNRKKEIFNLNLIHGYFKVFFVRFKATLFCFYRKVVMQHFSL